MATHQSIRSLPHGASQDGLVIHLDSLPLKAKKIDIESLLKERGFDRCTFFWPDMAPNQPDEHKGWCRVQFEEKRVAESAKSALQNAFLMGFPIKIGSIESTAVSTDRARYTMASYIVASVAKVALQALQQPAQAHPTTAPVVQTPQDPSASTESVAGVLVQATTSLSLGPPSPSAVRASNDPSPETAEDILRSLHISEYPRAGHYNRENPDLARQSVMSRQQLEPAHENAGVFAPPLVKVTQELGDGKLEMARRADGIDWQPGQLLGSDPQARAPISHSSTFITPAESSNNFQSATSRGHQPQFERPEGVGAGWGDHDLFREWQIHGREVKKSMVEDKVWCKDPGAALQFVPASDSPAGSRGVTIPAKDVSKIMDGLNMQEQEEPKTLFEMLNPKPEDQAGNQRAAGASDE